MNETAVIYVRVSSVGDRQDTSRQIRDLEILAKEKSLKVVNTYEEHISGAKKNSGQASSDRVPKLLLFQSHQRFTYLRTITSG